MTFYSRMKFDQPLTLPTTFLQKRKLKCERKTSGAKRRKNLIPNKQPWNFTATPSLLMFIMGAVASSCGVVDFMKIKVNRFPVVCDMTREYQQQRKKRCKNYGRDQEQWLERFVYLG
jgi:hypothetical protein